MFFQIAFGVLRSDILTSRKLRADPIMRGRTGLKVCVTLPLPSSRMAGQLSQSKHTTNFGKANKGG